jgi:hypothetical protein
MSVQTDPALYSSNFERIENERYFTEHWVTKALIPFVPPYVMDRIVWEPSCGRGDITQVLQEEGFDTFSSDIDISEFNHDLGKGREHDFLTSPFDFAMVEEYSAIITNPPYGKDAPGEPSLSDKFVQHALDLQIDLVAMLLRAEFNSAGKRVDLFDRSKNPFAFEVVLTSRPRWDWWFEKAADEPNHGPRHNFSWFVWDRRWEGPSTQFWAGKEKD